ncbi:amidohydrolase family protein [Oceanobacillus aidingensis]|uniref:Amidohydrolase family protein n=1 Tax=Oceanobacillus aidingensis TaxID=645964 RepID=A0ABV9JSI0_9BACI
MIIDVHHHPIYFKDIVESAEELAFRKNQFGTFKQSPHPLEQVFIEMNYTKVDKLVLLPEDISIIQGGYIISNEQIKKLIDMAPDKFIGFASVDPSRDDAIEVLEYAFKDLKLQGLKLHPSKQKFYPNEDKMKKIYETCISFNKPIIFHSGMTWQPDAPAKYSKPINFEEVAINYPELKFCLAHFGWPWIDETIMLLLKYPNVYTDTSLLHMDDASSFFKQLFTKNMGPLWIERNLQDKVMFGTNAPRFRAKRLLPAIYNIGFREKTLNKILSGNAEKFLG